MRHCRFWAAALVLAAVGCIPTANDPVEPVVDAGDASAAAEPVPDAPADVPPGAMALPDAMALPGAALPGAAAFDPTTALAEWEALAADALANLSNPRAVELGVLLQTLGPEGFDPLIAVLGDPDAAPEKKVFVVVTLQSVADPSLTPKLVPLTGPEHDDVTRSGAAQLISQAQDPATRDLLEQLSADENEKVRLAALQGLVLMNIPDAVARMQAMYFEPAMQPASKDRIVQTLGRFPQESSLPVYRAAVNDVLLEPASRFAAVVGLGSVGEAEDSALLDQAASLGGDDDFSNMVNIAKGQIASRTAPADPESAAPETPETPAQP